MSLASQITDLATRIAGQFKTTQTALDAKGTSNLVIGTTAGTAADSAALATSLAGKEPSFAAGTTTQYRRGDKSWQTLNSTAVGLSAVNNTADSAKPISTLQAAGINAKYTKPGTGVPSTDMTTAVQSALTAAGTAVQPGSLATVATSGAYSDLSGKPAIPAVPSDIGAATAAQGVKADTALQSAPVTSVNSKTGAVALTASDVSALPASTTLLTIGTTSGKAADAGALATSLTGKLGTGIANAVAGTTFTVITSTSTWPTRPTTRTDILVRWVDTTGAATSTPTGIVNGDTIVRAGA